MHACMHARLVCSWGREGQAPLGAMHWWHGVAQERVGAGLDRLWVLSRGGLVKPALPATWPLLQVLKEELQHELKPMTSQSSIASDKKA